MGELKSTNITLQMADQTVKRPIGVLEDVPVKVGKHFIQVDFVVLDIPEDIPVTLGRPFLSTANAIIDLRKGNLTLAIGEETVTFHLPTSLRNPMVEETAFAIDIIDEATVEMWDATLSIDLYDALMKFGVGGRRPLFFDAVNDQETLRGRYRNGTGCSDSLGHRAMSPIGDSAALPGAPVHGPPYFWKT
ncbi:hypothetical protein vseg_010623 [Gypsophila vaccaria]